MGTFLNFIGLVGQIGQATVNIVSVGYDSNRTNLDVAHAAVSMISAASAISCTAVQCSHQSKSTTRAFIITRASTHIAQQATRIGTIIDRKKLTYKEGTQILSAVTSAAVQACDIFQACDHHHHQIEEGLQITDAAVSIAQLGAAIPELQKALKARRDKQAEQMAARNNQISGYIALSNLRNQGSEINPFTRIEIEETEKICNAYRKYEEDTSKLESGSEEVERCKKRLLESFDTIPSVLSEDKDAWEDFLCDTGSGKVMRYAVVPNTEEAEFSYDRSSIEELISQGIRPKNWPATFWPIPTGRSAYKPASLIQRKINDRLFKEIKKFYECSLK